MRDIAYTSTRRDFIIGLSSALAFAATSRGAAAEGTRFSRQNVLDAAQALARNPYSQPSAVPGDLLNLDYDTYRRIQYRKQEAIWGGTPTKFSVELFAPGNLYASGIDLDLVENGQAFPIKITPASFEAPTKAIADTLAAVGQIAGFRLHYPINREEYRDEFVVFQGASYFRAVSKDQSYGLSARGLAIDSGEASGEEFPIFRKFWIERPAANAKSIVVHALLDSKRVTGAYRFGIYPGAPTRLDVEATLFARTRLNHVGLGALTSMYLYGAIDAADRPDYRPAVFDSTGLAIHTGGDERLWRPVSNPRTLQVSAFMDRAPKGFGLIQRDREFDDFEDLSADYQRRPSAWVSPVGDWGTGHVHLIEIPTPSEGNDNIVAYWKPDDPIMPGTPYTLAYQLTWPNDAPLSPGISRVVRSALGVKLGSDKPQFAIDYAALRGVPVEALELGASINGGKILEVTAQNNPATRGFRVFITFDPVNAPLCELRLQPKYNGSPVGETWLYRWTPR